MVLTNRAMELKSRNERWSDESGTDVSANGAATERAETEFHVDDALAETLCSLQAIDTHNRRS